jgi:hypothetical protein
MGTMANQLMKHSGTVSLIFLPQYAHEQIHQWTPVYQFARCSAYLFF